MENLKRVYCLYRVSTVGQVEKDDIPMQKQYCREFASGHPDWHIERNSMKKEFPGLRSPQRRGTPSKKSSARPCRENLKSCWFICLTVSDGGMMKRPLWWSGL